MELFRSTILHLDDYAPARYARTQILRQAGFEVKEAWTGAEALRLAIECKPQLAILDVNLPDMSGLEVCRRLKQDPATAGIIVLQLSAISTRPSDQVEGLETGADAYIVEPIEPEVLVATIRAMLRAQQAEQALSLITAHEEERRRLARELHDDVGQRLAALVIELEMLQKKYAERSELSQALKAVSLEAQSLSDDVSIISHQFHPVVLEDLGLESALRDLCAEFQRIHKMEISVSCDALQRKLSAPVSTALYRIAQEALRNASQHAPDAPVSLALTESEGGVRLVIEDCGPGFPLDAPRQGGALGLISMRERARMAMGTFSIRTRQPNGTSIEVSVPFAEEAGASMGSGATLRH